MVKRPHIHSVAQLIESYNPMLQSISPVPVNTLVLLPEIISVLTIVGTWGYCARQQFKAIFRDIVVNPDLTISCSNEIANDHQRQREEF